MFRVDGKYQGEIISGDILVIGESGEINGQVNVNTLIVHGKVKGKVTATKRIEIHPPGGILGDIQTSVLVISEGATFEGTCQMGKGEIRLEKKVSPLKMQENENEETEVRETE